MRAARQTNPQVRARDRVRDQLPHRRALHGRLVVAWRRTYPERRRAHEIARRAALPRPAQCERCGDTSRRLEKHHADYDQPLQVTWLCKPCHYRADDDRRQTEGGRVAC
jgi:hypothetical protein